MSDAIGMSERLRRTTEMMACGCSVPMDLWQDHSTAALEAATQLDALSARVKELEATQERLWCTACGTVTRDNRCDCNRWGPSHEMYREPHFVNYADQANADAQEQYARATRAEQERDKLQGMLLLCGELGGIGNNETPVTYLRRLIDGLIEAQQERDEAYERAAMLALVQARQGATAEQIAYAIRQLKIASGPDKEKRE